jgi:uncharacterized repeat protein (TIGR03837 family)
MATPRSPTPRLWDLFCRVIDNHGDLGVCWRLAADLAGRGQRVRLWADDLSALAWMAPGGLPGVEAQVWREPFPEVDPGDVVIEAFACDPPPGFVAAMARRRRPPLWLNLEYLSAEAWVERCHALPSPQSAGPGRGLVKWFFHPGFTPATGGLLRQPDLLPARAAFDPAPWKSAHGLATGPGERLVTLFCYANPALPELMAALGEAPTLLALTPGHATAQARELSLPSRVRAVELPWLSQAGYDRLLWSADLNFVRGEDSLVRALWAGVPFVWQLYPQHDGAHRAKAEAFLARWQADSGADAALTATVTAMARAWNSLEPEAPGSAAAAAALRAGLRCLGSADAGRPASGWAAAAQAFSARQGAQDDLLTQLLRFVASKMPDDGSAS